VVWRISNPFRLLVVDLSLPDALNLHKHARKALDPISALNSCDWLFLQTPSSNF
jgi:hypothetical protein